MRGEETRLEDIVQPRMQTRDMNGAAITVVLPYGKMQCGLLLDVAVDSAPTIRVFNHVSANLMSSWTV